MENSLRNDLMRFQSYSICRTQDNFHVFCRSRSLAQRPSEEPQQKGIFSWIILEKNLAQRYTENCFRQMNPM